MGRFESGAKTLVDAIEANDDDAIKAAVQGMVIEVGSLFERAVAALETLASAVDVRYDQPAVLHRPG